MTDFVSDYLSLNEEKTLDNEVEVTIPSNEETIIDEPVLTFYKYDTDGFYLGTTWQSGENTTDIPFEYESGYWYFFNGTDWDKVKIPESLSEITLDITLTDESTNYQKILVSLAQRLAAEYEGAEYKLVTTDNHYQVIHISEADLLKDQYRLEIQHLKKQLSDTDYKAIKYAEGQISESEYSAIRELRQGYRDRINYLEGLM
jgi:hypothetical protein